MNDESLLNGNGFISGSDFSKWLNNEYIPNNPDKAWIKDVSTKSVKQAIMNAHTAYLRFFREKKKPGYVPYSKQQIIQAAKRGKTLGYYDMQGHPKYKKKNSSEPKMFFVKNDANHIIECERHRIKIPTLGWVRIKEKGYLPTNRIIKSGSVSKYAGRYYVSVLVDVGDVVTTESPQSEAVGIDLGINTFATCSSGDVYKNVNKTNKIRKLEKKLKREQRKLSRKYESLKKRKNIMEGEATRQNIQKQVLKVQKIHQRLTNIRTDYVNKTVLSLVKTKPSYIAVEDLNVKGMMKNKHLAKAIAQQRFSEFRAKLGAKCKANGIELSVVDRCYPSSRLCPNCGYEKSDLKLSDRVYKCGCGYEADRDHNASLNIRDASVYKVA